MAFEWHSSPCLLLSSRVVQAQETTEYYGVDALGSVRVVSDQTSAVAARSDYLPFGESYAPFGNLPSQRFTGATA